MNKKTAITLSLFINYFVFAILLNSVGIVMLKSQNVYGVDELQASTLEALKDLPIAIVSFFIASFLPRIGYKRSMLAAMVFVTFACISMYFGNSFSSAQVLFAIVGVSFALIKISVYSAIGLITNTPREHSSLMSRIEGFFMFGIALAYFLFPAFNVETDPNGWLNVYWLLAGLTILSFIFLYFSELEGDNAGSRVEVINAFKGIIPLAIFTIGTFFAARYLYTNISIILCFLFVGIILYLVIKTPFGKLTMGEDVQGELQIMTGLLSKIAVLVFVISAFLFVMIEQGIMTWLPTFNDRVLNLPENISIMMSSVLAISLGIGRIMAGVLSRRFSWFWVLIFCLVAAMAMVLFVLPQTINSRVEGIEKFSDIPLLGFAFPMVGLFIAPIYPLLNSAILSALPKSLHSPMTGLIVIFSALGGTLGSRLIGYLFKNIGAASAFTYTLIPMGILFICLFILKRLTDQELSKQHS